MRRPPTPILIALLLLLAVLAAAGCSRKVSFLGPPPPGTAPAVRILSPTVDQNLTSLVVAVQLELENFVLDPPGNPVVYGHGHVDVRVDGRPAQPFIHDTLSLGLPGPGPHHLSVELRGNDGIPVEPVAADSVNFVVSVERTLSHDVEPIFKSHCAFAGCHAGPDAVLGEDLSSAASSYATTVNVASKERPALLRVAPGDPEHSYTVHKVRGDSGIAGQRMPLGGGPLSAQEIQILVDWIQAGAKNN